MEEDLIEIRSQGIKYKLKYSTGEILNINYRLLGWEDYNIELGNHFIEWINKKEENNHKKKKKYNEELDMEEIITVNKSSKSKDSLDNENNFILVFNSDIEYKKKILMKLGLNENDYDNWFAIKPIKKEDITLKHTEEWDKYKEGTGEKYPTSKSDIILLNKLTDEMIGISIKSGSGRLTSADCFETNSLFKTVLKYMDVSVEKNKLIYDKVNEIVNKMKELEKFKTEKGYNYTKLKKIMNDENIPENLKKSIEWIKKYEKMKEDVNKIWNYIREEYPEFVEEVLFECMRGKYKFGDNIGKAGYLIELESSKSTKVTHIYNLKKKTDDIKKYLSNHGKGNVICIKSSGGGLWCRFL